MEEDERERENPRATLVRRKEAPTREKPRRNKQGQKPGNHQQQPGEISVGRAQRRTDWSFNHGITKWEELEEDLSTTHLNANERENPVSKETLNLNETE